jgi:hypothetical protein
VKHEAKKKATMVQDEEGEDENKDEQYYYTYSGQEHVTRRLGSALQEPGY